jgi:chromatin segregation and condensation protein Rec8/ScpA/Scc1 (kleisin family)
MAGAAKNLKDRVDRVKEAAEKVDEVKTKVELIKEIIEKVGKLKEFADKAREWNEKMGIKESADLNTVVTIAKARETREVPATKFDTFDLFGLQTQWVDSALDNEASKTWKASRRQGFRGLTTTRFR